MSKENYLDFIPVSNPRVTWDIDNSGIVIVHVLNKGFYHFIAQKLFKRPNISHIHLDKYGSFIWQQMDGEKTIYEISMIVQKRFKREIEPLLERLVKMFQILYENKLIGYVKNKK